MNLVSLAQTGILSCIKSQKCKVCLGISPLCWTILLHVCCCKSPKIHLYAICMLHWSVLIYQTNVSLKNYFSVCTFSSNTDTHRFYCNSTNLHLLIDACQSTSEILLLHVQSPNMVCNQNFIPYLQNLMSRPPADIGG